MPVGNYPFGLTIVPFSPTPTFDCTTGNVFRITLTAAITSMSVINASPGHWYCFIFAQDSSGLHSVNWPANFKGVVPITILALANTVAIQTVVYDGVDFFADSLGQLSLNI
jgi:hypothetical protein